MASHRAFTFLAAFYSSKILQALRIKIINCYSNSFSDKLDILFFLYKSTPEVFLGVTLVDGERSATGKNPNAEHNWENV